MLRVGVLASGSGSNLQALIDAAERISYEIVLVVSNVHGAFALERAKQASIATEVIPHKPFAARSDFDAAIDERLRAHDVELVCLAGFMRILGADFVAGWDQRLINIHPSLLPSFRGLDTHARALAAGVAVHGCTVHRATAALDDGPILVQGVVPVLPDDDPALLAARVLTLEHRCYPRALELLVAEKSEGALPSGGRLLLDPLLMRDR